MRYPLSRVEVAELGSESQAQWGASSSQVRLALLELLYRHPRFIVQKPSEEKTAAQAYRLRLDLPLIREGSDGKSPGTSVQVGATLSVSVEGSTPPQRYDVMGLGVAPLSGEDVALRNKALQKALVQALDQALEAAQLQLEAAGKTDAALVRSLADKDLRVREFSLRVLADRGHAAAIQIGRAHV